MCMLRVHVTALRVLLIWAAIINDYVRLTQEQNHKRKNKKLPI